MTTNAVEDVGLYWIQHNQITGDNNNTSEREAFAIRVGINHAQINIQTVIFTHPGCNNNIIRTHSRAEV